jgi:hypothetical protein
MFNISSCFACKQCYWHCLQWTPSKRLEQVYKCLRLRHLGLSRFSLWVCSSVKRHNIQYYTPPMQTTRDFLNWLCMQCRVVSHGTLFAWKHLFPILAYWSVCKCIFRLIAWLLTSPEIAQSIQWVDRCDSSDAIVESITVLLRIWKVLSSKSRPNNGYPAEACRNFPQLQ